MGLLDKLKNTFFEEEYVEIEEKPKVKKEPVKKEVKKVEVKHVSESRPKITRHDEVERKEPVKKEVPRERVRDVERVESRSRVREKEDVRAEAKVVHREERIAPKEIQEIDIPKKEATFEEKTFKRETNFGYFDDEDFLDFTEDSYQEPPKKQIEPVRTVEKPKAYDNPLYGTPQAVQPKEKDERKGFKPTPIISPIYGILDKNYKKEEVIERKEVRPSSYVSRKNADLDSIREKAFGPMTNDFGLISNEDPVYEPEEKNENDFDIEDNLLYDMTEESKAPAVDKVTLQDAEEYFQDLGLEYNIDYKDAKLEKATGRRVSKTPKIDEAFEEVEEEVVPPSKPSRVESSENSSLEDNLFDLIDSMYEDKE